MPPMVTTIRDKVLPLALFPAITYFALDQIFGHAIKAGVLDQLTVMCTPAEPYKLSYFGIPAIDSELCGIVAFFDTMLDHRNVAFNISLLTGLAPLIIIPFLEASRQGRSIYLELHPLIGVIYQRFTGAAFLPFYWIIFITTGAASLQHTATPATIRTLSKIDQKHAEAAVVALFIGFILPSVAMLSMESNLVTGYWQFFPIWTFLTNRVYLLLRTATPENGFEIVEGVYMFLGTLSVASQWYFVLPLLLSADSRETFKAVFVPSLAALDPIQHSTMQRVMDFIQWDALIIVIGTYAVSIWVAGWSVKRVATLTAWWIGSLVLLGPGASISGVFWWREKKLNEAAQLAEAQEVKRSKES